MKHIVKSLEAELQQVENLLKHNSNRLSDLAAEQQAVQANVSELAARRDNLKNGVAASKSLSA